MSSSEEFNLRKILIFRFSSLGDIVMTTAMIRSIRRAYPRAQIDMVVRADFIDLIRHNPHLDKKIAFPRGSGIRGLCRLLKTVNREHYDLIYDAHRSLRTILLMPFLRARYKRYFDKRYIERSLALTFKCRLLNSTRFLERFIEPLLPFGVSYDGKGPEVFLGSEDFQRALRKVPELEAKGDPLVLALIPSAQWPGKRWPVEHFKRLLERIVDETPFRTIIFGGKNDDFCKVIAGDFPTARVVNTQGKLTLAEAMSVLGKCHLTVANDTGLMHVADALNVPSVLFLGPTSAGLGCLPFHPDCQVLEHQLWCRPCSKNGQAPCIRLHRYCLELTSPDAAFEAVIRLARMRAKGGP